MYNRYMQVVEKKSAKSRLLGWVIIVVGIVLAVKTTQNLIRLWKVGDSLERSRQELQEAEKRNSELKARLVEVKSDGFAEEEARNKLGYVKPGEELLIIPPQDTGNTLPITRPQNQKNETNLQAWWRLYINH
jgi:cell division protein FtsB